VRYLVQAVPFLLIALIVGLTLAPRLRGRLQWKAPARPLRPKVKSTLRVTPSQIDEELQELIRRRSS
jgi:hypothetical protein